MPCALAAHQNGIVLRQGDIILPLTRRVERTGGSRVAQTILGRQRRLPPLAHPERSPIMRAERAKLKSCKDDETIAQGKRSAALGYGRKMIPSFPLRFLRASGAQNRKGKRGWVGGGSFTQGGGLGGLALG